MPLEPPPHGMRIGETLKGARKRQGLDVRTVEERTKIRTKYLRALESEDWEVLPNDAYAKGFLRTYAQTLGLDGDALVDEYRRQHEGAAAGGGAGLLSPGPPNAGGPPRRWPLVVAAIGLVALAVLLVIGLSGGDDEGDGPRREAAVERRQERSEARAERRREARRERRAEAAEPARVTLRIETSDAVSICLLGDSEQPLIDAQVVAAGSVEGPYEAERFELRFPFGYDRGQFELFLNGERERLPETSGPTAYEVTPPARLRAAPEPGEACP